MSGTKTFKIRNVIDSEQLTKDLTYSLNNLSDAMVSQASLFAHYAVLAARAAKQVDDVKLLLENTEAAVYRKLRDDAAAAGEKVTETQLEKMVARHERVVATKKALNEAKQIEKVANLAVESFRHRRDMLVQLGAYERQEMQGELAVRVREAREQEYQDMKESILARRNPQ